MHDTTTRRRKENSSAETSQPSMDTMKGQYKINNIYLNMRNIKLCLAVIIGVIILYQLWKFSSKGTTMDISRAADKIGSETIKSGWRFEDNPQGQHEEAFGRLIEDLKTKDTCPHYPFRPKAEVPRTFNLPKKDKIYKSEGTLKFKDGQFILDDKPFRILSGAMHYFRVRPEQWKDRMLKMKAMGLNTLETYVSWNLHEDKPGKFDFEGMLDVVKYIELAHEVGLYVIFRPGPYICSEWDFGGLPAWLLKDPNMKVRSNYKGYLEAVDRFFGKLIPMVEKLQHVHGGPIIAVQIENEFGSYSSEVEHLMYLKKLFLKLGIKELLFYSDGMSGFANANFHDEALPTANFKEYYYGKSMFQAIRDVSKDFPLMNTEFWSGWFDHWNKPHAKSDALKMADDFCNIMKDGASVNFYMWHGGTNFGFMAGANWFEPQKDSDGVFRGGFKSDITSYDYIAPLSEAGDITPKYEIAKTIIQRYASEFTDKGSLQFVPQNNPKAIYGEPVYNEYSKNNPREGKMTVEGYLPLDDMLSGVQTISLKDRPVPMELLNVGDSGYGQNYGFILYRTHFLKGSQLKFSNPVQDRAQIFVNGVEVKTLDWNTQKWTVDLPQRQLSEENTLDILVENHGRVNYVHQGYNKFNGYVHQGYNKFNEERKGISGDVLLDNQAQKDWLVYPLEFKTDYFNKIYGNHKFKPYTHSDFTLGLYKGSFVITAEPTDSFINMKGWNKGIVIVNGFNLGRYWNVGPQRTLYLPAPVLKRGENKALIFELHKGSHSIVFQEKHVLE